MKVCQLCAVDFTLRRFLLPLVDAMTAQGWTVEAVCSSGPETPELRAAGYAIRNIEIARSMNPFLALVSTFRLLRMLFSLLHRRARFVTCNLSVVVYD